MNNLPGQPDDFNNQATSQANAQPLSATPQGKEGEVVRVGVAEFPLQEVGNEVVLPKEVASSGVQVQPAQTHLPQNLVSHGVVNSDAVKNPASNLGDAIQLPLTDEQIATGLHQSVSHSVRWLAEWCVRKMKMVHKAVKVKSAKVN